MAKPAGAALAAHGPPKRRHCRYCMNPFKPRKIDHFFCKKDCRLNFWIYGGMPMPRIMAKLEKHTQEVIRSEMKKYKDLMEAMGRIWGAIETAEKLAPGAEVPRKEAGAATLTTDLLRQLFDPRQMRRTA